jgi:hypothetical protein
MKRVARAFVAALLATTFGTAAAQRVPEMAGLVRDGRLGEISGMAASPSTPDRFWVHNDSGSPADVFAIDGSGRVLAQLRVTGVKPVDWEDMAAFALDGRSWLLLADTGDNGGVRPRVELVVVEEPSFAADANEHAFKAAPAWRIAFRYADEPHDVEAVGVDTAAETVLLLTKRTTPLQIWSLPLRPGKDKETVATLLGTLRAADDVLPTVDFERRLMPGRPTALSISRDARRAAVLTYNAVWIYDRAAGESWAGAFARTPRSFPIALLAQAEAVAFGADADTVYVTGERWPVPLLRLDVTP